MQNSPATLGQELARTFWTSVVNVLTSHESHESCFSPHGIFAGKQPASHPSCDRRPQRGDKQQENNAALNSLELKFIGPLQRRRGSSVDANCSRTVEKGCNRNSLRAQTKGGSAACATARGATVSVGGVCGSVLTVTLSDGGVMPSLGGEASEGGRRITLTQITSRA